MINRDVTPDEEREIHQFMTTLAGTPVDIRSAPAGDVIWLKARLLQRWHAEETATLPLDVIEPVQVMTALAATVLLLLWSVPALVRVFTP